MKKIKPIMLYGMITLFAILIMALSSCNKGYKLNQLIDAQNNNNYVYFERIDNKHLKVTAIKAVWLEAGYQGDTIPLNPSESVLLRLPDDEFDISVGNGDDDVHFFIF